MAPKSPALQATGRFSSPAKQVNITDTTSAGDTLTNDPKVPSKKTGTHKIGDSVTNTYGEAGRKNEEAKANKPYVKKGGTATGSMKDYKIGSQERADEYTSRGWAQDETTKVTKKKAKIKVKDPVVKDKEPVVQEKVVDVKQTAPKKEVKQSRSQKIRAKGEAALASGDKKKAHRLRKRFDRVEAREAKKAARNNKHGNKPTSPAKIAPLVMALAPMAIEMMKGDK